MPLRNRPTSLKKNHPYGFTLIEILCALVLVGLLGSFFLGGYINSLKMHFTADSNYQQAQKTQIALLRIILEMQGASTIATSGNIITYQYNSADRKILLSETNLVLYTSTDDTNHTLIDSVSDFNANYTATDKTLSVILTIKFQNNVTKSFTTYVYVPQWSS